MSICSIQVRLTVKGTSDLLTTQVTLSSMQRFSRFGTILPVGQYPSPSPLFFRINHLVKNSPQNIPPKGVTGKLSHPNDLQAAIFPVLGIQAGLSYPNSTFDCFIPDNWQLATAR